MPVSSALSIQTLSQSAERNSKNLEGQAADESNNPAYDMLFTLTYLPNANVPDQGLSFKEILHI